MFISTAKGRAASFTADSRPVPVDEKKKKKKVELNKMWVHQRLKPDLPGQ